MLMWSLDAERMSPSYGMLLQSLTPSTETADAPFGSLFGVVEPGTRSKPHRHHESELFVILSGEGELVVDGESHHVEGGDAVFTAPFEQHSLRNLSAATPLELLSIYWDEASGAQAANEEPSRPARRVVVTCPPPTPNGGLHLGHVAGPYLRADVYRRGLSIHGIPATLVTGTDDHQTYVDVRAASVDELPDAFARRFGDRIVATLRALDIDVDIAIRPARTPGYREAVQGAFELLTRSDAVKLDDVTATYCRRCDGALYQAHVKGECPTCGSATAGGLCEDCGFPNEAGDLVDPRCVRCGDRASHRLEPALVLSSSAYAEELRAYHAAVGGNARLAAFVDRLLETGLPDYRLTRFGGRGIPVTHPRLDGHVVDVWVELMLGQEVAFTGEDEDLVQFLGFDNSYFYAVLYPVISFALDDSRYRPVAFMVNEFLALDQEKFSTSRDHAIWADDALASMGSDALRLAMLTHCPETKGRSLSRARYDAMVDGELIAPIEEWLGGYADLSECVGGRAPTPGAWTEGQQAFFESLAELLRRCSRSVSLERFSGQGYSALLLELVDVATRFRADTEELGGAPGLQEELRTAQALDLLAAKTFAIAAAPAMPRLARRLHRELGLEAEPSYEAQIAFLPGGARLAFDAAPYFPVGAAQPGG